LTGAREVDEGTLQTGSGVRWTQVALGFGGAPRKIAPVSDDEHSADPWVVVTHRVIYGDTDAMGIVYYGTYLRFLEVGRNEYLRAHGGEYRKIEAAGFVLPVLEVNVRYRAPAEYDDVLRIKTRVGKVSKVQLKFEYEVERESDGALLVTGHTSHATLDRETRKLVRLPECVTRWLPVARSRG